MNGPLPSLPIGLFGAKDPKYFKEKETFRDRAILFLVAQGMTDTRIAEELCVSASMVSNLRRQPWFVERLVKLLHDKGEPAIERRLQAISQEMMELGRDLAYNAKSEAVRATSIFSFLKIARGEKVIVEDKRESAEELRAKRTQLEAELKAIRGEREPSPLEESTEPADGDVVSRDA